MADYREGTYQLKRRRLKPDVRDSTAWRITTWWKRTYEGLFSFTLSHLVLRISLAGFLCLVLWLVCGFCLFVCCLCVLLVSCFQGNLISILLIIPVVDRPCLALARQCRKKKILLSTYDSQLGTMTATIVMMSAA